MAAQAGVLQQSLYFPRQKFGPFGVQFVSRFLTRKGDIQARVRELAYQALANVPLKMESSSIISI